MDVVAEARQEGEDGGLGDLPVDEEVGEVVSVDEAGIEEAEEADAGDLAAEAAATEADGAGGEVLVEDAEEVEEVGVGGQEVVVEVSEGHNNIFLLAQKYIVVFYQFHFPPSNVMTSATLTIHC